MRNPMKGQRGPWFAQEARVSAVGKSEEEPKLNLHPSFDDADRERSPQFNRHYANRTELSLGNHDLQILFVQTMGTQRNGKLLLQEQSHITMTHETAISFHRALGRLLEERDRLSRALAGEHEK